LDGIITMKMQVTANIRVGVLLFDEQFVIPKMRARSDCERRALMQMRKNFGLLPAPFGSSCVDSGCTAGWFRSVDDCIVG
jgi:hypothetical protein